MEALTVPFCHIHMYRRFADAEFLCSGADRGPVLYDVKSQALCPLLHISFQQTTLPASCWFILCGAGTGYERRRGSFAPAGKGAGANKWLDRAGECAMMKAADNKQKGSRFYE